MNRNGTLYNPYLYVLIITEECQTRLREIIVLVEYQRLERIFNK
jgi:hypothetical protein